MPVYGAARHSRTQKIDGVRRRCWFGLTGMPKQTFLKEIPRGRSVGNGDGQPRNYCKSRSKARAKQLENALVNKIHGIADLSDVHEWTPSQDGYLPSAQRPKHDSQAAKQSTLVDEDIAQAGIAIGADAV